MFGLGFSELMIVGVLVFIFFGAKRLPSLGGDLAKGIRNFQKGLKEEDKKELENKKDESKENKE